MTTNSLKDASIGHATPAGISRTKENANRLSLGGCNFALSLFLTLAASNPAVAGPEGGQVVGGDATIDQNGRLTQIFQGSDRVAINWDTFNVGLDETVRFIQPSSTSVALNHIFDQNASQIFGAIDANGRIFLINPNGLVFGATAQVNVASLVASSLGISTADFMAGNYTFEAAAGSEGGLVLNQGSITAAEGGFVALLGQAVANEGLIVADAGTINLASGNKVALDFDGGGLLFFEVQSDVLQNALGQDSAVSNSGSLVANGGQVLLTARAAQDVFTNAINNEGLIQAQRIDNQGGVIRLLGSGGDVLTSGVLDASGAGAGDTGGTVQVLGNRVAVYGDALIDVSGDNGGGLVQIGGSFQGADSDVQNASDTYVGSNAVINADAGVSGDGGDVVVWADGTTRFYGDISARGGDQSGDGGAVEVSGKKSLVFAGGVNTSAAQGQMGSLLLDPDDIVISNTATAADDGLVAGGTVAFGDTPVDPLLTTATISAATLEALSSATNISLQATNSILIEDLSTAGKGGVDNELTLATDGTVEFYAGAGGFSMNTGDTIHVTGTGSLTIDTIGAPSVGVGNGATGNGAITTGGITTNTITGIVTLNGTDININGDVVTSGGAFIANSADITNFDSLGVLIDTTGANNTAGGDVSITTTDLLTTGGITTSGGADIADVAGQDAGAVTLTGGNITAGAITSTGSAATTGTNTDGADGVVTLSSTAGLTVQNINAGNVSLRVDADDNSAETLALAGTITSSGTVTLTGSNTNANDTLSASNAANEWAVSSANTGTLNSQ
ncbi:MAG: filamentous hemagglutinin N-terminal domain-containing protein, partial [Gammaproteobacteria bacterium]|nr:filamentous hemagglutinin N-terminal domain-containing protein [Gammaproteobacteria bacterium]